MNERLEICKSCEHYLSFTGQCKVCMCFMRIKTALPFAECPKGKWGKDSFVPLEGVETLTEEDINFVMSLGSRITKGEQETFWNIYRKIQPKARNTSCRSCLVSAIKNFKQHL